MARVARAELFDPAEVSVFHCINRCVRRCFLCGCDPLTGRSYEHRMGWLEKCLKFLAGQFGIDFLAFAILSNHFHLVLRNRPDVVATWSGTEVARRWLRLCRRAKQRTARRPGLHCCIESKRHRERSEPAPIQPLAAPGSAIRLSSTSTQRRRRYLPPPRYDCLATQS